jgi:hypothetical protein
MSVSVEVVGVQPLHLPLAEVGAELRQDQAGVVVMIFFSSSLTLRQNKLERLSLANVSGEPIIWR